MRLRNFSPLLLLAVATFAEADGFRLANREGRLTEYSGMATLNGRFERRQDAETLVWRGDRICFWPDGEGAAKLPGEQREERYFCFSNHSGALAKLKLPALPQEGHCGVAGTARVAISRFVVETGNAFDEAWLDRVDELGPPSPLPCP